MYNKITVLQTQTLYTSTLKTKVYGYTETHSLKHKRQALTLSNVRSPVLLKWSGISTAHFPLKRRGKNASRRELPEYKQQNVKYNHFVFLVLFFFLKGTRHTTCIKQSHSKQRDQSIHVTATQIEGLSRF